MSHKEKIYLFCLGIPWNIWFNLRITHVPVRDAAGIQSAVDGALLRLDGIDELNHLLHRIFWRSDLQRRSHGREGNNTTNRIRRGSPDGIARSVPSEHCWDFYCILCRRYHFKTRKAKFIYTRQCKSKIWT